MGRENAQRQLPARKRRRAVEAGSVPGKAGTLRLMIVSANAETRSALQVAARDSGLFHSLRVLSDGRFALENLWDSVRPGETPLPDITIADVDLAGLSVSQLVRQIRQSGPMRDLFVAAYAPSAGPQELDQLEGAGVDFIIRKPDLPGRSQKLFRTLVQRHAAKRDPAHLNGSKLTFGTLGGSGLDVPPM